jgi:hypothetical protein
MVFCMCDIINKIKTFFRDSGDLEFIYYAAHDSYNSSQKPHKLDGIEPPYKLFIQLYTY